MLHRSYQMRLSFLLTSVFSTLASLASAVPPVIDTAVSGDRGNAATTVAATGLTTSAGNELLLAFVATDYLGGTNTTVTGVSGGGLSWQRVARTNVRPGTSEIWRTLAPNPLSNVAVTATLSQSAAASITVIAFRGVDTSGTSGSGAIGATASASSASGLPSATLTTTRVNSIVVGVGNDYTNAISRSVPANQTLVHQYLTPGGDTYWVQRLTDPVPTANTVAIINDTSPGTDQYNLTLCEVLGANSTSGDVTPPSVTITGPANGALVSGVITLSASASDDVGVAGVQFRVDGANVGAELVTSPYSTQWTTTAVTDGTHTLTSVARDAAGNVAASAPVTVTVANSGNISLVGQWSAPFDVGLVAVNSVLLHTGKVLMFQGQFVSTGTPAVWDPASGSVTQVPNTFYNLFCAGHAQLADGRVLVMGGYDSSSLGAPNANIFDPVTATWSAVPNMAYRRWYPSGTTLPDGRILVTSGAQSCLTCLADIPEIYNPITNKWTSMTSARLGVPYYPFMYVLPNGKVVDAGANEETVATSTLDPATGTWTMVDPNVVDGHSSAMYLPGKILKTGTAADSGTMGNAASTAYVIDMNQATPAWRQVASMAYPRAFQNTTILADGSVLVTGGGTTLDGHDGSKAVLQAELWSPATETWQILAKAQVPRLYHSTALLLPDGRVFSAGGGNDTGTLGGPAIDHTQAEIFSPPYLFKGSRPTISSAPSTIQYGSGFTVQTPNAASIATVSLIRLGAVTHAFNEDQRYLALAFQAGSGSLTVQAPANANLAPPGYYMLFIVNTTGVPSLAAFVRFPSPSEDSIPPTAPGALTGNGGVGTASLSWTASTDNTGVSLYNIHRSVTPGVSPSVANRIGQTSSTTFIDHVAAGTYYYVVTAQDVAGNISAPSSEVSVPVFADTTPPSISMTAPADGANVSGTVTISANASDDVGVAGVQFLLDGAPLGAERTTAPYSMNWNTTTTQNGTHPVAAVARDASGNTTTAPAVYVNVSNSAQTVQGLVAAYGFNEGAGVQTADASGLNNVGTLGGATWTPAGKYGAALSFNGSSSWVTIADAASLHLTTGMTIEAWINPASSTGWRSVVLKERSGGLAYALYGENNANRPAGYLTLSGDKSVNGNAALPLNTWTHVAVTYDGATLRVFINGAQAGSTAATGSIAASTGALRIGGNAVWGEYFNGLLDEVRIYNRALSAAEIQADMNTPVP
jgi:hypothetical protein